MHRDEFRTIVQNAVLQSLTQSGSATAPIPDDQLQSLVTGIADGVFAALEATLDEGVADDYISLSQPNAAGSAAAAAAAAANAATSAAETRTSTAQTSEVAAANIVDEAPVRGYTRGLNEGERLLWRGRPYLTIGTIYELTSQRLRILRGIVSNSLEEIELVRVRDTSVKQNMGERMFDIGDIEVLSNDMSKPRKVLHNVRDPMEVREMIRQAVVNERERRGLIYREEMGDGDEGGTF